jgi:predicted nucleic acid-binding protein
MKTIPKLRLYLDTTIPSYLFAIDAPERMEITRRLMRSRGSPEVEMLISEVVLQEVNDAPEPKRVLLLEELSGLEVLPITAESKRLADEYIRHKILPARSLADARHVALAVLNEVDALVSWNFGHLVNIRRSRAINEMNNRWGLASIEIVTPQEVLE